VIAAGRNTCLTVQRELPRAEEADVQPTGEDIPAESAVNVDDCWNRIGVQGDRSCPELARHTHCRNCHTYAAAGRRLLDKPLNHADCDFWSDYYAQPLHPPESHLESFTLFRVCNERFAIPTLRCVRVANMRPIHRIPHRSSGAILGIANIHGELIVCVSFASLLSLNTSGKSGGGKEGKLLVTRWADGPIAFEVDELENVQRVAATQLKALPATVAQGKARCTKAMLSIGGNSIGVLDEALLEGAVRQNLA
jgi:chemotaxis-related protein WspD